MKKTHNKFHSIFLKLSLIFFVTNCGLYVTAQSSNGSLDFAFQTDKLAHNPPQYAIWIEDAGNNYIETVFITDFVGKNGGGNRASGSRENALPVWSHKRNIIDNSYGIDSYYPPSSDMPSYPADIDAVTGATHSVSSVTTVTFSLDNYPYGTYRCWIEVNQSWDPNTSHTDNTNGQPSVLWYADIKISADAKNTSVLNYYGYGSDDGSDGNIRLADATITTATDLLKTNDGKKFSVIFTPHNKVKVVVPELNEGCFSAYPNPCIDQTTITTSSKNQIETLFIFGSKGRLMAKYEHLSNESKIDMSSYKTGLYILELHTTDNHIYTKKLIKK